MTLEGLGEMFRGYSAETCAGKFPLVPMGLRAEGPACQVSMEEVPDWSKADYGVIKSAIEHIKWEDEFKDKSWQECLDLLYEVIKRETER